ncbi:MAG: hypothetical protein JWP57_953 [Spirosoma sp.]|nr:hypothetical protein [Spirosoma sp.]
MNWLKKPPRVVTLLTLIATLLFLSSWTAITLSAVEKGYIKGKTRAIIRVYEESADNTKGPLLYSDWIQQDEYISVNTEKGKIIYDYRYSPTEEWTTDIHVACRGGREEAVVIP